MNRYFFPAVTAALLLIALVLVVARPAYTEDRRELRPVLISLSSGPEDIQQASMALTLAGQFRETGRPVTLFVNSRALELVDTDKPDVPLYGRRTMLRASLATMIGEGLEVMACPTSMSIADVEEASLLEGVAVADGDMFIRLLDKGAAVFSY